MITLFDADAYVERHHYTPWYQGMADPRGFALQVLRTLRNEADMLATEAVGEDDDAYDDADDAVSNAEALIEWLEGLP